ncbi:MAG: FKBP-type peptidyl-prolyl cis-trans isomerase, partial [Flammeovirgaceae bacterium]|nr:FKBP-type peptidyl-prolyl cis-trans isomerase [Flammeovirgaceae bacterium]MDW8287593.1 FKBP-type peptidyl-prolyl cis-trans isomerase [Flammeovirgaceae bacterium]
MKSFATAIQLGTLFKAFLFFFLVSCNLSSKQEGTTFTGKKFTNHTSTNGKTPVKGSYVTFYYFIYDTKGELKDKSNPSLVRPYLMRGDSSALVEEALMSCREGDSVTFYLQAKDIFQGGMPPYLKSGEDSILLSLKIVAVQTEEEMKAAQAAKDKNQLDLETKNIENHLKQLGLIGTRTASGLYYVIQKNGEGKQPKPGDFVTVHYKGMFLDNQVFDESITQNDPFVFQLGQKEVIMGWDEGIALLKEGSKALLLIPSALAYGDRGAGGIIAPNTTLKFEVELLKVQSAQEREAERLAQEQKRMQEEDGIIQNYLKKNNLKASKTPSGLYYALTKQGTGLQPSTGNRVSVHYKGTLLDGTVFDESYKRNEPLEFVLGRGQVIRGWDEGIALLKEGGKAVLIVPSRLAYGDKKIGQHIQPNSVLRFD